MSETTVADIVRELKKDYNIEETTFVGDRGMITKLNLLSIEKEGFDYIMGVKIRQSEIYEMLFDENGLDERDYSEHNGLKIQERQLGIKDFLLWKTNKILSDNEIRIDAEKFEAIRALTNSLTNKDTIEYVSVKPALAILTSDNKICRRIFSLIKKYEGQYENKIRTVVCLNEIRKSLLKSKRDTKVSNFSESLSEFFRKVKNNEDVVKTERRLDRIFEGHNRRFKKFFTILRDEDSRPAGFKLNEKKISVEDRLDGVFVITTSRQDISIEKVVDSYKNLKEVEMLFDDLKNFVDIRPVRHWLEDRVRSHVFLCVLALLLKRIFEINHIKGKKVMIPLEEISKSKLIKYEVRFSEKEDRCKVFPKVTNTTPDQMELFKLVGIKNPMSLENFVW